MAKAKDANWFQGIVKIERTLTNAISWICTVWFAVMILCMVWQVVSRFILHISVPWTDEASRYLWITLCFIGAGAAISDNEHVEINIIASLLKKKEHNKKFWTFRNFIMIIEGFNSMTHYKKWLSEMAEEDRNNANNYYKEKWRIFC